MDNIKFYEVNPAYIDYLAPMAAHSSKNPYFIRVYSSANVNQM